MWFFLIFLAVPVIEIALFLQVGSMIGIVPTIALVLFSAVVGMTVMRRQGAAALRDLQRSFTDLRDPTQPLAHGAMILLAGALLLTPGFFTDTVGLLLLVPTVRRAVLRQAAARVRVQRASTGFGFGGRPAGWPHSPPGTIDGDYVVQPDDMIAPQPPRGTAGASGWTRPVP